MKLSTHLNETEIKEAIRQYVERELHVELEPDAAVHMSVYKASGSDPREHDSVSAVVEYKK